MIQMTYDLAIAAGQDAADKLMRRKDLRAWDTECSNRAIETFHDCYGHEAAKAANGGNCPECQPI